MPRCLILLAVCVLPATAAAQRTCSFPVTRDSTVAGPIYAACATDRPARLRAGYSPLRYPEVFAAAGIRPVNDPVVLLVIDSTGVPVPGKMLVAPGPNHPGFQASILRDVRSWRFDPALRDGHPVASYDTLFVPFPTPPRPLVPRDCVDCDTRLYHAQLAVEELQQKFATCAIAMRFVGLWEVVDSTIWAFDQLPTCPGATEAAILAIRIGPMTWKGSSMHFFWERLASIVRTPAVADEALETARRGSRASLKILAYQLTGWARVDDSLPARWDFGQGRPQTSCGPIRVAPRLDPTPSAGDTTLRSSALALTDSIVRAAEAPQELRASAWCLRAQLGTPGDEWKGSMLDTLPTPHPDTQTVIAPSIAGPVFVAPAVDLFPRPREVPAWPEALRSGWDHDPMGWATVTIFFGVDSIGRPEGLRAPYLYLTDTLLAQALFRQFRAWRFMPVPTDRHAMTAADTVVIHPPLGSRWDPPRTCSGCDSLYSSTYWRVSDIPIREIQCDSALSRLAQGKISQWEDWMYVLVPRCRGVAGALARNLRRLVPLASGAGLGTRRATLIASVHDPAIVRELMSAARRGQRYAFRFLPIALGLGYSRVADSTAGHWDQARGIPADGCGPIEVFLPTVAPGGRRIDPREVRRARTLADSVATDPATPAPLRSSAWCLAAQLAP